MSLEKSNNSTSISILEMSHEEARAFLLQHHSYCNFPLPKYIDFNNMLNNINTEIVWPNKISEKARDYYDVNHKILNNKGGKYAWRKLQLINPVIYVSLVNEITEVSNWSKIRERFNKFSQNPKIVCKSIPRKSKSIQSDMAEQVSYWSREVEQKSLELALEYRYLIQTDIVDCYSSIYTHTISWALHDKEVAKDNRFNNEFIGNIIDKKIQCMSHTQTNGIPEGSTLMDFIAEMVLGYIDLVLSEKIDNKMDYFIIRYRDDCRIFAKTKHDADNILKMLNEIVIDHGLKINHHKTEGGDEIIKNSLKKEKWYWITQYRKSKNLQEQLLRIHDFAYKFPNSGMVRKALSNYRKTISKKAEIKSPEILISIISDMAYCNPKSYPIITTIIAELISHIKVNKMDIIDKITRGFSNVPNTGYLDIWLQRITYKYNSKEEYKEKLCKVVANDLQALWKCEWLDERYHALINNHTFIDSEKLKNMTAVPTDKEVELFMSNEYMDY